MFYGNRHDHAGIATQMVVERQLAEQNIVGATLDEMHLSKRWAKLSPVVKFTNSFAVLVPLTTGSATDLRWMQGCLMRW